MDGPEYNLQGNRMLQLDKLFVNWQEINEKRAGAAISGGGKDHAGTAD